MNQKQVDIIGSATKRDSAAPPKYKNVSNPEAINQQIQAVLGNPNSEAIGAISAAVSEYQDRMKRKLPKNQRTMIDSGRQIGYNNVSNINPIMPNFPMGLPISESYDITADEQALLQMQDPNPPTHYAETGGLSTLMMSTPPAWYKQDMISNQKARQGGVTYNRQTPTGANNYPETQLRHNPVAPLPQRTYMPSLNMVNQGDTTSLNRQGNV